MSGGPADSILWVAEGRAALLAQVARATLAGWFKDQLLERPAEGVFHERDVLEVLLVGALREELSLSEAKGLWRNLRRAGVVGEFLDLAEEISSAEDRLDLIMDPAMGRIKFARDAGALLEAVRDEHRARTVYVAPLGARILLAREGFANFANTDPSPTVRRGRPPQKRATLSSINPDL